MRGWRPLAWWVFCLTCIAWTAGACTGAARTSYSVAYVQVAQDVRDLANANDDAYRTATETVTVQLVAAGHHDAASYTEAVKPLDAELDARTEALAQASTALYAAAGLLDAADHAAPDKDAARLVLRTLTHAVDVLSSGDALPPVVLPARVRVTIARLTSLVGTEASDAGDA